METINKLVVQIASGQNLTTMQSKQWPHLEKKSASLKSCHSNLQSFCTMYNPSLQKVVADNEERAILGMAPMLCTLDAAYGVGSAVVWIIPQLHDLCAAVGVKTKLDDGQLKQLAQMIRDEFGYLKATEVMLFLWKLKAGHYGEFYGSVDIQRIMRALRNRYIDYRNKILDRYDADKRDRERQERAKTALTPEQIKELKKRLLNDGQE